MVTQIVQCSKAQHSTVYNVFVIIIIDIIIFSKRVNYRSAKTGLKQKKEWLLVLVVESSERHYDL